MSPAALRAIDSDDCLVTRRISSRLKSVSRVSTLSLTYGASFSQDLQVAACSVYRAITLSHSNMNFICQAYGGNLNLSEFI